MTVAASAAAVTAAVPAACFQVRRDCLVCPVCSVMGGWIPLMPARMPDGTKVVASMLAPASGRTATIGLLSSSYQAAPGPGAVTWAMKRAQVNALARGAG
ncbi:hypothetical protein GCM10010220_00330 [Streptomyces parvulus]|nr:hypothetical protein GCM10010220_00330 [Streptomyces parvulus]